MAYQVMASIDDEPTSVHVEDCDDLEQAKDLVKSITEEGFFYHEDEDNLVFYSPWMINTVSIRKANDVRD